MVLTANINYVYLLSDLSTFPIWSEVLWFFVVPHNLLTKTGNLSVFIWEKKYELTKKIIPAVCFNLTNL